MEVLTWLILEASSYSTDRSKTVALLQFFLVRASLVTYVAFVLSVLVPPFSLPAASGRL